MRKRGRLHPLPDAASFGGTPKAIAIGDINGDEHADVVVAIDRAARFDDTPIDDVAASARSQLEEFRSAGPVAWQDLRTGLEDAWIDLRSAFMQAQSRFQQDEEETGPAETDAPTPSPTDLPDDDR